MFCFGVTGCCEGGQYSGNLENSLRCFWCLPWECRSVAKEKVSLLKHNSESSWGNITGARNLTRNVMVEKGGNGVR